MASISRPTSAGEGDIPSQLQTLAEEFCATDQPMFLKLLKVQAFVSDVYSLSPPMQESNVDDLIESIEAEEFPARRLKLELANLLRRPLIILEYMKKEEKLLVKRALQFNWIYFDPCSLLTSPKTVTRIVLPSVSYATRMKVIRGLSKYLDCEKSGEKMFSLIQEKYGVSSALELLPACSPKFIQEYLSSNRNLVFRIEQQQSLRIARKDYSTALKILEIIFEYMKCLAPVAAGTDKESQEVIPEIESNGRGLMKRMKHYHHKTIEHLSIHHTKEFSELFDKYAEFMRLKPKPSLTKSLCRNCKDQVIRNGRIYKEIISLKILHKCLTEEELIEYATSCLPNTRESFLEEFKETLEWMDKLYCNKWKVVGEAFKRKYDINLESEECLPSRIMRIMPVEMRQNICRGKVEKANSVEILETPAYNDSEWVAFCELKESIPKLKGMVSQEKKLEGKRRLVELLVESCYINGKNVDSLIDVGKFLLNTEGDCGGLMRFSYIDALIKKFPDWIESSRITDILREFVKIYCVKKDTIHPVLLCCLACEELFTELLTNDELLNALFSTAQTLMTSYGPNDTSRFNFYEFLQLTLMCCEKKHPENVPVSCLEAQDVSDLKFRVIKLTQFICQMNLVIDFSDSSWLKNRLLEIIRLDDNFDLDCHAIIETVKHNSEFHLTCLKDLLVFYPDVKVVEYFLRKKPETIFYNIEPILSFMLSLDTKDFKAYRKILFKIKSQSYSALQSAVSEICLETVQNEGLPDAARENAITTLSILWDSTNFLHIISLFYPTSPFATEGNNLKDDLMEFESKYRAKKVVVESFINTSAPTSCLKPLGNFCVGDYLKISLGSLYSSCFHAKPSDTIKFLREELLDSPLPLKKHAVKLLLLLSTREDVEELLAYLWESESHLSVRKILVSSLCNFASQNSGDTTRIWSSVIRPSFLSLTTVIDSTESESIELLKLLLCPCNVLRTPYSCIGEFLQICVNILDLNEDEKTEVTRRTLKPYLVKIINQFLPAISHTQRKFLVKKQYCIKE